MSTDWVSQPVEPAKANDYADGLPSVGGEIVLPADESLKTLGLIEAVAEAKDRNEAIVAMVKYLANQFAGSHVRCGIGGARLRRYYDYRLGWLGPASELYQNASSDWEEESATLPTRPSLPTELQAKRSQTTLESIRLNIDDEIGLGRCVLWIDEGSLTSGDRTWLKRALPSLRAILWQQRGGTLARVGRGLSNGGVTTRVYLGLATLFVALLAIWPVSYRVRCTTVVRPTLSRIVSAPFDATLEATHVEPGNSVKKGDRLLSLDGRPLRLELEAVEAQIGQVQKERDVAMVAGRVAESQQAKLRVRELTRQRDLLLSRLQRLDVVSPIDGVVVFGDLDRSIGAPLETGQAVIEIAPLEKMVIELEVPEYEIGYVDRGTPTRIRLTAAGGDVIERKIDVVYPSAELRDDVNVFVAQVNVDNKDGKLRPGMRGDAIAYGPVRPWLWSLVRTGWEKTLWWVGY